MPTIQSILISNLRSLFRRCTPLYLNQYSGKLLFDEEGSQVRQLPRTRNTEDSQLD